MQEEFVRWLLDRLRSGWVDDAMKQLEILMQKVGPQIRETKELLREVSYAISASQVVQEGNGI
jgi:hypothetical protein